MRLDPGDVREIEHCEAIRRDINHFVQRRLKRPEGLEGETVDEIDIDAVNSDCFRPFNSIHGYAFRLQPVDRFLDTVVEILNAKAHPIDAPVPKCLHVIEGQIARIDLHTDFCIRRELEIGAEELAQLVDLTRVQIRGGTTTPCHLCHLSITADTPCDTFDISSQCIEVLLNVVTVPRHEHRAAAKVAQRVTERNMQIEGNWRLVLVIVSDKIGFELSLVVFFRKNRRSRITRVPWTRFIEALQQVEVNIQKVLLQCAVRSHNALLPSNKR